MPICEQAAPPFSELALNYLDGLYRYAIALTRNRANAEDLVQETYLRAARVYPALRPHSNVRSWMYTILRNVWVNQFRRKRTDSLEELREDHGARQALTASPLASPYEAYVDSARSLHVQSAIQRLPEAHREIIILRVFEELSYEELAEVLQIPRGTVMSRLARARDKLRILLGQWNT